MIDTVEAIGIVADTMPIGEADIRVVLLTSQLGKVVAFARGARRQNSPLLAVTNVFVFGKFYLRRGRDAYNIDRFEGITYFDELRKDYIMACYGVYFLEYASYLTMEEASSKDEVSLIYLSLKALTKKLISYRLIKVIFEFKYLVLNGTYPQMDDCVMCRSTTLNTRYLIAKKGIVCQKCMNKVDENYIDLSPTVAHVIRLIINNNVEKLYIFKVSDEILEELIDFVENWKKRYIKYNFKSLKVLEELSVDEK